MPSIDDMMAFENGDMPQDQIVPFFQDMIDSGIVWQLQGSYGRMAARLIESGFCHE